MSWSIAVSNVLWKKVIPKLIHDTREFFHDLFEEIGEKLEDLVNRDEDDSGSNDLRVRNSFSIGSSFKALDIELADDRVLDKIRSRFSEVINIIPDEVVQFELPRPITEKKKKNDKRYYIVKESSHAFETYISLTRVSYSALFATAPIPKPMRLTTRAGLHPFRPQQLPEKKLPQPQPLLLLAS